jgi:hypothetical protein
MVATIVPYIPKISYWFLIGHKKGSGDTEALELTSQNPNK